MRATLAVVKKELNVYFTTPIAYIVFTVVGFFAALFFSRSLDVFRLYASRLGEYQGPEALEHFNLTDVVVGNVFGSVAVFLVIGMPFLSMWMLADERRNKTLELLLTSPIRPASIVIGKYLASLLVLLLCIALLLLFPLLLTFYAKGIHGGSAVEWQTVSTGLLGLFLLGAMSLAVGLFVSSLTENPIVAFLVTWIVLFVLFFLAALAGSAEGPLKDLALALSSSTHTAPFIEGRVELKDLFYFLSFVVLGLWLTDRVVEGQRWS